ncbi:MAG: class I SAM-dependent methyltransferase [Nitrosomonas sp.]|nr:MAG: class I SAM-dependent methyltransferase [Nitrosomonas sp.]
MEAAINKGDIINHLITQFKFSSYLEYNKFDGATYYDDICCASKTVAYLPENSYLDGRTLQRLLGLAASVDFDQILSLDGLLARYAGRRFDLIFFDPVHVRPDVDLALQTLPHLLNPDGVLVVHDCNPTARELTSVRRRPGSWVGETYKAFALFRHFNRAQTLTIAEDFGVGLIWNHDLRLDYPTHFDLDYADFAQDRVEYIGLTDYASFLARSAAGAPAELFRQAPPTRPIALKASVAPAHAAPLPLPLAASAEAQLFWRSEDTSFSAAMTLTEHYRTDAAAVILAWTLPQGVGRVHELRFDFADRPLSVRLDSIQVRAPDSTLAWEWMQEPALLENPQQATVFIELGEWRATYLQATGEDPRCRLALPASLLRQFGAGWQVRIGLSPLPALLDGLLAELARCQQAASGAAAAPATCMLSGAQHALIVQALQLQSRQRRLEQRLANFDAMLAQWRALPD